MSFFDRLSNGWKLGMSSLQVIKKHKQLVLFPVLSGFSLLVVMASFFITILGVNGWHFDSVMNQSRPFYYFLLFIMYLLNYFVVVFFNVALIHCARLAFKGEKPTIGDGISFSMTRLGAIFSWAILAATVGLLLKVIAENLGKAGQIITAIFGIAWSITTFFVVPVIAYENTGPIDAVKTQCCNDEGKMG